MRSTLKWIVGVCCLIGIYWVAQSHSILDALALSLCAGGLVWIRLGQADSGSENSVSRSGER